jgi:hypothetical protein
VLYALNISIMRTNYAQSWYFKVTAACQLSLLQAPGVVASVPPYPLEHS